MEEGVKYQSQDAWAEDQCLKRERVHSDNQDEGDETEAKQSGRMNQCSQD